MRSMVEGLPPLVFEGSVGSDCLRQSENEQVALAAGQGCGLPGAVHSCH
jgi:hypothetical protein